jgi:hypothetical protein
MEFKGSTHVVISPHQNGVDERKNRHIATPTTIVHGMTPEEKFIGKKPDV